LYFIVAPLPGYALWLFCALTLISATAVNVFILAKLPMTRALIIENLGDDWFSFFSINMNANRLKGLVTGCACGVALGAGLDVVQVPINTGHVALLD
jgi:hypothetical protein